MVKEKNRPESGLVSLPQLNMTPMIDVIFQLLIFFMCTIHFRTMEGKLQSFLPKKKGNNPEDPPPVLCPEIRVSISYNEQAGKALWRLCQTPFENHDELIGAVVAKHQQCPIFDGKPVPVIVDADQNVPFSEVVRVLDMCTGRGIEALEFAMPPLNRER